MLTELQASDAVFEQGHAAQQRELPRIDLREMSHDARFNLCAAGEQPAELAQYSLIGLIPQIPKSPPLHARDNSARIRERQEGNPIFRLTHTTRAYVMQRV